MKTTGSGGMKEVAIGPAREADGLQITRVDRANPPDLKALLRGLDGMRVDSFATLAFPLNG